MASAGLTIALAGLLLVPALLNGFPLVFPDSGTYLGIATGHDYAIDRSSLYGFLLKPFVSVLPGLGGLWLAIVAQVVAIAVALVAAGRALADRCSPRLLLAAFLPVLLLTSLPWHAAQFMPDAFTGPLVLLACLAVTRPGRAPGAAWLWLAALLLALTHYTHIVLLPVAALAATAAQLPLGLGWRAAAARIGTALAVCGVAVALLAAANGAVLGRATMSPLGPFFLFARLHEDGLAGRWLDRHCGRDAPAPLCAARPGIPRDSQTLLWGGMASPLGQQIWGGDDATRWHWIDMMATANRGAIREEPLAFLTAALRGTVRQFASFAALDDECPANCGRNRASGVAFTLLRDRPTALPALDASMQLRGTLPKRLVRAITPPVAAFALLLLPAAGWIAWRRRDAPALAFCAGIGAALIANAALAGALSDVHDRYQSRIVWLAPFLLLFLMLRWRAPACPPALPGA